MVTNVVPSPHINVWSFRTRSCGSIRDEPVSPAGGEALRSSPGFSIFLGGISPMILRHIVPVIRDMTRLSIYFAVTYG